jgi:drug/metabolite transporter (DMT)-like permease
MHPRWKYEVLILVTVLVWGLNFPIIKIALGPMHPHVVNAFRFTASALVLGLVYVVQARRTGQALFAPYRTRAVPIIALGLLAFVVYQYCYIIGMDHTTAGSAALIMSSAPLWTAITGARFNPERLRLSAWTGLAMTLFGTAVIVLGGRQQIELGMESLFGNLMMLAAAIFWGGYTALSKPVLKSVTPSGLAFLGLLPSLPFLYGLSVPHFAGFQLADITPGIWVALAFSGALSTGLAVVTWSVAVRNLGASHTAAFGNLVPIVALGAGFLILHEPISPVQLLGGALILSGLYLVRRVLGAAGADRKREALDARNS